MLTKFSGPPAVAFLAFLCATAHAADQKGGKREPVPHAQDRPPGPALSPQEAMARMKLPPGFAVELAAAEPDVVNPTAMTFDSRGRIWVCESFEYPRKDPGPGKDRVKILEDADGDGRYEKVTVFKDGLNIPCGVVHGNGGVYVTNSPDVLFLKDTDGDDKADTEEVVLTGFGRADTHELPNSLTWGPDGWLYGMNGVFNPSKVKDPATGKEIEFTCAVWRYHPPTKRFELFAEGTSNPWGLDFNRQGDWFLSCCVIDHLFHITQNGYYHRQGGPYPPLTVKMESIATEKHQKAAYAGLLIYDADAYPAEYRGRLLMGNLHGSCLNQDLLTRNGSTYTQKAGPDFLTAADAWFMPVAQKLGPDGCVYVMDWYDRYHCYQDANRDSPGLDRGKGRVYRISYNNSPRVGKFDLSKSSPGELLKLLDHPNVWWRREAQRLLTEKGDDSLTPALQQLALDAEGSKNNGHMHALWVLVSRGKIDPPFHLKLLSHADPAVRNWGVRAAGEQVKVDRAVAEKLVTLAADPSPDVRLQLAVAAGRITDPDPMPLFAALLGNAGNAADRIIPNLIYNGLKPLAGPRGKEILALLESNPEVEKAFGANAARWLRQAVNVSGRPPGEITAYLKKSLSAGPDPLQARQGLQSVLDALGVFPFDARARHFDPELRAAIAKIASAESPAQVPAIMLGVWWRDRAAVNAARKLVATYGYDSTVRVALLKGLAEAKLATNEADFAALAADDTAPVRVRALAVDSLGTMNLPAAARRVVSLYAAMPADLKPAAVNALTRSPASAVALVEAVEKKQVPAGDVNANHVRQILALNHAGLSKRITAAWGTVKTDRDPEREKVVQQMRQALAAKKGDPVAGWAVFDAKCAQCHTIYGKGGSVGPDITGVGRETLDLVLTNVLDPNLVIGKPYYVHVARLKNGTVFSGLLVEESDGGVVLKDNNKTQAIRRDEIDKLVVQNVSMMPEGLEKTMTEQEFADLVAFLLTREPPRR